MKLTYGKVNFSFSLFGRLLLSTSENAIFENIVAVFGYAPVVVFTPWSAWVSKNLNVYCRILLQAVYESVTVDSFILDYRFDNLSLMRLILVYKRTLFTLDNHA